MLIRMYSPAFKENGNIRKPIEFHQGLNVILGQEDGKNSIGKSSALLAVDFILGGQSYVGSDGVKHIGDHDIFFSFKFNDKDYHFVRNTFTNKVFSICKYENGSYERTGLDWDKKQYLDWLTKQYELEFEDLSIRETLSSFFRIYGKENIDELHPLRGVSGHGMERSIDILIKLFNKYPVIKKYKAALDEEKDKVKVYKAGRKYKFISDLVGGKAQYEKNIAKINQLELDLATLSTNQDEAYTSDDIQKGEQKNKLDSDVLMTESNIQSLERRLKLVNTSIEIGIYPTEADLNELSEFFPNVNVRKIYEVEKYHQKLAFILDKQFIKEKEQFEESLKQQKDHLEELKKQLKELGIVGNFSKEFLKRHAEINNELTALRTQNEAYVIEKELEENKKKANDDVKQATEKVLREIEVIINSKMEIYNKTLFKEERKPPRLTFKAFNSYSFVTPDDTGTGSNFKGLAIYDLSVLNSTSLPMMAHDSLIFKNISDEAVNGLIKLYGMNKKQIFISFDKQNAYSKETMCILQKNEVLSLSYGGNELYGISWGTK